MESLKDVGRNRTTRGHGHTIAKGADLNRMMAEVYGRLTGNPAVCLATLGPGASNLITGVADANMDLAPLVAIAGQHEALQSNQKGALAQAENAARSDERARLAEQLKGLVNHFKV